MQVQQFLEFNFPELQGRVSGGTEPLPPMIELINTILSVFQLAGIVWMIVGGENLFRLLGFRNGNFPKFYWTIRENAGPISMAVFFIIPQIVARFTVSGAFEIYLNDEIIFSKIEMGRFPDVDDLVKPLVAAGLRQAASA